MSFKALRVELIFAISPDLDLVPRLGAILGLWKLMSIWTLCPAILLSNCTLSSCAVTWEMAIDPFEEETQGEIAVYTCCDVTGPFLLGVWIHVGFPLLFYLGILCSINCLHTVCPSPLGCPSDLAVLYDYYIHPI